MAAPTVAELTTRLEEVDTQLAEMVGAPDFSIGTMTVDETKLHSTLTQERLRLANRIANMNAGGGAYDNGRAENSGPAW